MKTTLLTAFAAAIMLTAAHPLMAQSGQDLFQQALVKERADGELMEAIALYEKIVEEFTYDRELVARALVQMGGCYEKLGQDEAQRAYQRVVDEYADQSKMVQEARSRLAQLARLASELGEGPIITTRRVWAGREANEASSFAPTSDGRKLMYVDLQGSNNLMVRDLMTGSSRYLEPIRSMAEIRLKYLSSPPAKPPAPGSEAWCTSKLGGLSGVIAKYRFLTGSNEFDQFLMKEQTPYLRFRLHGDLNSLVSALRSNAEALRINFPGYTSEVRYTDRVLRFPALFGADGILPAPVTTIHFPNTSLLYSTVTGDFSDAGYFPLNAVRWLTPPRNIAVLVTNAGRDCLTAELFHFGREKRPVSAELYLLDPGEYTLIVTGRDTAKRETLAAGKFEVKGRRTRVSFEIPPMYFCVLDIRRR